MSPYPQILVLNIPRQPLAARTSAKRPEKPANRLGYLRVLIGTLKLLGFRFATVEQALTAPRGRWACLTFEGEGRDFYQLVYPWLERRRIPATLLISPADVSQKFASPTKGLATTTPSRMTWKNLRELMRRGWQIGTTGLNGVNLTELSYQEQKLQITEAKKVLTTRLGVEPELFAYPLGAYDATSMKCLREAGFQFALTRERGIVTPTTPRLRLHRFSLTGRITRDIAMILSCLARRPAAPHLAAKGAKIVSSRNVRSGALP